MQTPNVEPPTPVGPPDRLSAARLAALGRELLAVADEIETAAEAAEAAEQIEQPVLFLSTMRQLVGIWRERVDALPVGGDWTRGAALALREASDELAQLCDAAERRSR